MWPLPLASHLVRDKGGRFCLFHRRWISMAGGVGVQMDEDGQVLLRSRTQLLGRHGDPGSPAGVASGRSRDISRIWHVSHEEGGRGPGGHQTSWVSLGASSFHSLSSDSSCMFVSGSSVLSSSSLSSSGWPSSSSFSSFSSSLSSG